MKRLGLLAAVAAALVASPAVAQTVTAPSYSTATGNTLTAQGVFMLNADGTSGGLPVRATSTTTNGTVVDRFQRSVASLLGLTILSVPSAPGATWVHIICLEP